MLSPNFLDWIYVKWDNGTHNAYRYNENGKVDVEESKHHPRELPLDSPSLDFGVRVVRGKQRILFIFLTQFNMNFS